VGPRALRVSYSDKPRQTAGARVATILARIVIAGILLAAVAAFVFWTAPGR